MIDFDTLIDSLPSDVRAEVLDEYSLGGHTRESFVTNYDSQRHMALALELAALRLDRKGRRRYRKEIETITRVRRDLERDARLALSTRP